MRLVRLAVATEGDLDGSLVRAADDVQFDGAAAPCGLERIEQVVGVRTG